MDKQNITRQLHRLAQEEIPENMNLWPRIQGQLKRKAKPRSFSLAHALSVFVMTILVSVGGYAAYQSRSISTEAIAPNEVAELNIVQKGSGITTRLDWAYADANIISIQYTVIYNPQEVTLPDFSNVYLSTSRGQQIPQDFGGGGGGGGGDGQTFQMTNQVNFDASVIEGNPQSLDLLLQIDYDNRFVQPYMSEMPTVPPPDAFVMTSTPMPMGEMQATVVAPDSNFTATPFQFTPSTATPTAIGEMMPTALPPEMMTIEPSLIPPMQFTPTPLPTSPTFSFTFSFTIPFHPAKTGRLEANPIDANGVQAEIQNLRITPLMTRFDFCYDLPDFSGEWYPKVMLNSSYSPSPTMQNYAMGMVGIDGELLYPAQTDETALYTSSNRSGNCYPMQAFVPFSSEGGEIEIVVDYLYRYADATNEAVWAADVAFFRERGIELSYSLVRLSTEAEMSAFYNQSQPSNVMVYPIPETGALLITIRDYANNMDEWQTQQYIYDNLLRERYEGPWVFQVEVE